MISRAVAGEVYTLAMTAYRQDVKPEEVRVWIRLLQAAGDVDDTAAMAAVTALCLRPGQFPPTPGDVISEARAQLSPPVPSMDAAIGHYLAGNWDAHPAIREAAGAVWWDRRMAEAQAVRQFRQLYTAATENPAPARVVPAVDGPTLIRRIYDRGVAELEGPS